MKARLDFIEACGNSPAPVFRINPDYEKLKIKSYNDNYNNKKKD